MIYWLVTIREQTKSATLDLGPTENLITTEPTADIDDAAKDKLLFPSSLANFLGLIEPGEFYCMLLDICGESSNEFD